MKNHIVFKPVHADRNCLVPTNFYGNIRDYPQKITKKILESREPRL